MSYDGDAQNYFNIVESISDFNLASIQPWLTPDYVKYWINDFIIALKSTGNWDDINSAVLLRGPRTLNGALIALKGVSPTNLNFIESDYNGQTGLKGDGSTKYLDSNLNSSIVFSLSLNHLTCHISEADTLTGTAVGLIGTTVSAAGSFVNIHIETDNFVKIQSMAGTVNNTAISGRPLTGFIGINRQGSSSYNRVIGSSNSTYGSSVSQVNGVSITPDEIEVYRVGLKGYTDARLSWYSIGRAVNIDTIRACYDKLNYVFNNNTTYSGTIRSILRFRQNVR